MLSHILQNTYLCSKTVLLQNINKELEPLEKAITYYRVISAVNDLSLTERDIQLLAYTNKRGTISSITAKQEFVRLFDSSIPTVNNMISKLKRKKLLVKVKHKVIVNPVISFDFSQKVVVVLRLDNK